MKTYIKTILSSVATGKDMLKWTENIMKTSFDL